MENNKKCSSKKHQDTNAISFCIECDIFMCNKCANHHNEILVHHHKYNLNENINEIFTGFCIEEGHKDKLDFYCKDHNKLCCVACLSKIKKKGIGQHTDCNACLIEDIKNEKKNKLKENLKFLEDFSNEIENSINELKNSYSIDELNNENFNEFLLTRGSLKAIELLNDKLYFKLFKNENFPNIEIIIVYRIYFQLVNKEKNIIEENDIEIFWKKVKEYFINKNNNNIQIGNLLENQFKQLDFSKENFVKIYNLCEGKINKLTPVYYSKICATTGLFIFLIKEALEYFGIINDKKKTQINRIYQNLCFLLEIKKKEFEKL